MNKYSMDLFNRALQLEGISGPLAELARSIYAQESGSGANTKTSHAGAHGGMQIIPSTFKSVADSGWDINNPEHNIRAGLRYIQEMDKVAGGDPRLTAIGYYGGPGGIQKAKAGIAVRDPRPEGVNAPDTFGYADEVLGRIQGKGAVPQAQAPAQPPITPADMTPEVPTMLAQEGASPLDSFRQWGNPGHAESASLASGVQQPGVQRQSLWPDRAIPRADFSDSLGMIRTMMAQNQNALQGGWAAMRGWL